MSDYYKSYRIKYDVHCRFENFFGKEIIIKNCMSELHAKMKLGAYCEKHYGKEFDFITFKLVNTENFSDLFNDIFDDTSSNVFADNNWFNDIMKKFKNKKK